MSYYEIETDRLLLRQWRDGDWIGLHRTYGDPEVMAWIGSVPGMFAVEERSSGDIIGRVGVMRHPDWPLDGPRIGVGRRTPDRAP